MALLLSSLFFRTRIRIKAHPLSDLQCLSSSSLHFLQVPTDSLCLTVRHPLAAILGSVSFPNVALLS